MSTMPPARAEVRRDLVILAAFAAIVFFLSLGARDLWNPNEPIYGLAVAEMASRGDWLLPTVNGIEFVEKPILYFWMARLSSLLLGGVTELSLRLPSALGGLTGVFLVYPLVVPYAGRFRARIAAVLFATTFAVFWGARTIQMDVLVMAAGLGAVLAVSRTVDHGLSPWVGWPLAGVAAGLGFAAKGPVGLICPGIPIVLYLLVTKRSRRLASPVVLVGAIACVVVASPWFLLLLAKGRIDLLHEVLVRQNITRFVQPWDHQASWWYYLYYFWIDMAPWSWLVPLAWALPGRSEEERRLDRLAWWWLFGVLAFFTLSLSKRSAYILPAAPAVAVLVSGLAERFFTGRLPRWRATACLCVATALGLVSVAAGVLLHLRTIPDYPGLSDAARSMTALLVVGGAVVVAGVAWPRRSRAAVGAALLSLVLVAYILASVLLLPAVNAVKSPRGFCDRVASLAGAEHPVASFGFWRWRAGYAFYLERPIPNLGSIPELREYWDGPSTVFLIVEKAKIDEARRVLGDRRPVLEAAIGSKTAYLFSNVRPSGPSGSGS